MTKTFIVSGMSCSACSSGIERAISKLDGVESVNVSLIAKQMTVSFDELKYKTTYKLEGNFVEHNKYYALKKNLL